MNDYYNYSKCLVCASTALTIIPPQSNLFSLKQLTLRPFGQNLIVQCESRCSKTLIYLLRYELPPMEEVASKFTFHSKVISSWNSEIFFIFFRNCTLITESPTQTPQSDVIASRIKASSIVTFPNS